MTTERLIGIDFGTSTTVIRVKRYRDGDPISDPLETRAVTFNMGSTMVPTLVKQAGDARYYGFHAANTNQRGQVMYQNFKVELESEDAEKREQAKSLTRDFMKYLAGIYREQSEAGHLGESGDRERTLISYPVKWKEETKRFMVEAAKEAGFANVKGMDEASAAIQAVTVQNADMLTRKGYFKAGVPVNILLIDMGAGTTDLVLCRHTPGLENETKILCTWPKSGNAFFGGSQVDAMLREYIKGHLPEAGAELVLPRCGVEKFKVWKEETVSPALKRGEAVNYCAPVEEILELIGLDMKPFSLDRAAFEAYNRNYLGLFPRMIADCLKEAGMAGSDIDMVILTGGHSQWYFVSELLKSAEVDLKKIIRKPERMMTVALPQETVALGLVYTPMKPIDKNTRQGDAGTRSTDESGNAWRRTQLTHVERVEPSCTKGGNIEYWKLGTLCYSDNEGRNRINIEKTLLQPLGHDYRRQISGNESFERCARCGDINIASKKSIVTPKLVMPEAEEATPDSEFDLNVVGGNYEVVGYHGNRSRVIVPETIRGKKVVAISGAFDAYRKKIWGDKTLQYVSLPKTVTRIGPNTFMHCVRLKEVHAHGAITEIGDNAFRGCVQLEVLDFGIDEVLPGVIFFPTSLQRIGKCAFSNTTPGAGGSQMLQKIRQVYISKETMCPGLFGDKTFDMAYKRVLVSFYENNPKK